MTNLICDISMSLDGLVAGPNPSLEHPLGEGGERLHEWAFRLASFRETHGLEATQVIASPFVTHLRFQRRQAGGTQ